MFQPRTLRLDAAPCKALVYVYVQACHMSALVLLIPASASLSLKVNDKLFNVQLKRSLLNMSASLQVVLKQFVSVTDYLYHTLFGVKLLLGQGMCTKTFAHGVCWIDSRDFKGGECDPPLSEEYLQPVQM